MHMISNKDLSDAVMDTLTKSHSSTIVIISNGEVQTHEKAIVCVKKLDILLTMRVFEDTPVVLSLGKLYDKHGYFYEWINGQKTHLIENGIRTQCNTENFVLIVIPCLSTSSSSSFPCAERRNDGAVLRVDKFDDLITADYKVFSDNCESRNNHRYAVVVQDLDFQWIQTYSRETCKSSWKSKKNQKSFTLTIPWNSAKVVKIFPGIIARLHHTDGRLMGLLKKQCAE